MITFTHADARILYAIPVKIDDCPIWGIVMNADVVNHAIPMKYEIESALSKGLRVGLLERSRSGVRYANAYRDEIYRVAQSRRYILDALDVLHLFLEGQKWEEVSDDEFSMTDTEMQAAVQQYFDHINNAK